MGTTPTSKAELQRLLELARKYEADGRAAEFPTANVESVVAAIERGRLEGSLYEFVKAAWRITIPQDFVPGKHIQAVCEHLEAVTAGQIKRLLINVPYRSSKSSVVSVMWPCWEWAQEPSLQYLCFSHKQENATRDTRNMRTICKSEWYQQRWPIGFATDQNLKMNFRNDAAGGRIGAGMTTGVMGANADRIIIDDPMSIEDTFSQLQKETIFRNYDEEISRRLNVPNESAIVVCGQRVDHDDFFAHLLSDSNEQWEHLVIPMRYELDHPHRRTTCLGWSDWRTEDGELMCPERFPEDYVVIEEQKPGAAGQLQQRPSPRGGGLFKSDWLTLVDEVPREHFLAVRYFDCASSRAKEADFTAGARMLLDNQGVVWLEDMLHGKWTPGERDNVILATVQMDGKRTYYYMELEGGSAGPTMIAHYTRLLMGYVFKADRVSQRGNKERRAEPLASYMQAGNVRIRNADWTRAFLEELLVFPRARHDDMVDAASGAFNCLMDLQQTYRYSHEPLIASGEDPVEERRPFTEDEMAELPDFLRELVSESRVSGMEKRESRRWGDDES